MKLQLPAKNILFTALCFAITSLPAEAKNMYKWVDKDGKTFFSDQVPPSKSDLKHEVLDKNARVVEVQERAKTKAELEIDKRLMLLRKQQEQIIAKQKAHDKKLLSNFLSIEAMDSMYKNKVMALEGQERELSEKLKELEKDLASQQEEAAGYEIKNTKVPVKVLTSIEDSQKKLAQAQKDLKDLQLKKVTSKKEFEADRARFLYLTKSTAGTATVASSGSANDKIQQSQPGLFSCESTLQCEKAWGIAKEFVKANSTVKIGVDTDTLVMSEDPVLDTDMSLSVSKIINAGSKPEIFLDIRCRESSAAKALCASSKADDIRNRFNDYIKANLNAAVSTPTAKAATPPSATPGKK
jgi:hypothetical protein